MASARWKNGVGMDRVRTTLGRIERAINADKLITWAGPKVVQAIKERTAIGVDVFDRDFVPYSTNSAAARRYVKERKGGRRTPVTLSDTGLMQGNLKARKKGKARISVAVRGAHSDLAEKHQRGMGNVPERRWLGMSQPDMRKLNRDTLFYLESLLKLKGPGLKARGTIFRGRSTWTVTNPR